MAHVHLFHDMGRIATFTPLTFQEDFKLVEEWRFNIHETANWNPMNGISRKAKESKTIYTRRQVQLQWRALVDAGYNKIGGTQEMIDFLKSRDEWNVDCTQEEIDKVLRYV